MTASAFADRSRYSIYTGRITNWPMVALSAALTAPLLILGSLSRGSSPDLAVPLLVAAVGLLLNVLTGSSVRTSAGPIGVSVRFGLLGWPHCTYRLDQIEHAEVIDLPNGGGRRAPSASSSPAASSSVRRRSPAASDRGGRRAVG